MDIYERFLGPFLLIPGLESLLPLSMLSYYYLLNALMCDPLVYGITTPPGVIEPSILRSIMPSGFIISSKGYY